MTKMASFNQKSDLIRWAALRLYPHLYQELMDREIWDEEMTFDRYKKIRNAILYEHDPQKAFRLIEMYPKKKGGEQK